MIFKKKKNKSHNYAYYSSKRTKKHEGKSLKIKRLILPIKNYDILIKLIE